MYYFFNSCLILFFLFSLIYQFPCASSKQELGWCEALFQCGNITAGFPFWGGNRHRPCGHPLLELRCIKNITSLNISNHEYKIFHIDQTSNILRLARADLLGSFCSSTFNTTTMSPEIFELSPTYKSLTVLYHCDPKLPYRSSHTCPGLSRFTISQSHNYQNSCQNSFSVNVPTSFVPEERELNLTHLESALREGFEVKLVIDEIPCQDCSFSRGICGFNSTTQVCCNVASPSGGVSCIPQHQPSADELRRRCSEPFSCGDQRELNYPFWIPGREYCGHPDFKLHCNRGFAELNIDSMKFRILKADYYYSYIIRLDYIDNLCLPNPLNVPPLIKSFLTFLDDTELLTLYYDCQFNSSAISATSYAGELGCDGGRSYYVTRNLSSPLLDEYKGLLNNLRGMCKKNVSVPVYGSALKMVQRSPTLDNLKKAIGQGFYISVEPDCSVCLQSWGACGYNQTSSAFVCYCKDGLYNRSCPQRERSDLGLHIVNVVYYIIIASCSLAGVIALLVLLCPCFRVRIFRKIRTSDDRRREKLKALIPLKHYTYAQVKKITKSFAQVVGKGGFGVVYKGTLSDGRMVAVKVLKDSNGNGEDFINEVASMSQTSHVNIASLLGFCSDGSKRAIIYEFLGNGSLEKFISDTNSMTMDLTSLYGVALGIARGVEYLHYGCRTRIVHFDIKPHNVLLDDNLCPKVSDFGLAKLCEKKESIMSLVDMRGTIGYIAPEMISRVYGTVSHKSDVYSYGMLVLEMIGARNKERVDQNSASEASSMYFPEWIYKDLEKEDSGREIENGISNEEDEIAKKMTLVGLWCIQSSPLDRPPMNKVVEMMEGSLESLQVPPSPVLHQIPAAPLSESFWISEESSSVSDVLMCSKN